MGEAVSRTPKVPGDRMTSSDRILLPEIGVMALVVDHWSPQWQVRHHVLSRLASYFQVVWVTPAREWRDVLRGAAARDEASASSSKGLAIYVPPGWLPIVYRPKRLGDYLSRLRLRAARRMLLRRGCKKVVLYLWRPDFAGALHSIPHDLSCYHIDDEYTFSDVDLPLDDVEAKLIKDVDQVFVHSPALLEKKGSINPRTAYAPNGVDFAAFSTLWPEPEDLARIPHPRIGYAGFIKRTLDWPLLSLLTERHREWSFVFVGPKRAQSEVREGVEKLSRRANVYFLEAKPARDLPAYPQHFDVCILPYQVNDYTKYIFPVKLHEYLAGGRPTVGARMRTLEDFADVVTLASTPDEWSSALAAALEPEADAPEHRTARQAVARQYDWDLLVARIAKTMAARLGAELPEWPPESWGEPQSAPSQRQEVARSFQADR